MAESQVLLSLENISKDFGATEVLKDISIAVEKGEFITFLGPSGCGKTTMLRIIAGLEVPSAGRVLLDGQDVTFLAPNKRDVNTVFQNYALFPHMNVYDNIAYSLKLRRVKKPEIRERVTAALELIQMTGYEKRSPAQLSGGQRQRVAIARSIVNNPKVLLLDEPLGALDLQLRRQMQVELKKLQKQLGITFIYITHDQEEAINMSDRIVVMKEGRLEQIGTPSDIYDYPRTSYVAQFIGTANLICGEVVKADRETFLIRVGDATVAVAASHPPLSPGQEVTFALRGENVTLASQKTEKTPLAATVVENHFAGGQMKAVLELPDGREITASRQGRSMQLTAGQAVYLGFHPENAVLVDLDPPEADPGREGGCQS